MACILVVDDEDRVRTSLRKHLQDAGYQVIEASGGAQAMELFGAIHIDLVILDLYMDDMDGIEFTIRLRQRAPSAKIIAISGGGQRDKHDALQRARRLGVQRTLAKPFTGGELTAAVGELLSHEEGQASAPEGGREQPGAAGG